MCSTGLLKTAKQEKVLQRTGTARAVPVLYLCSTCCISLQETALVLAIGGMSACPHPPARSGNNIIKIKFQIWILGLSQPPLLDNKNPSRALYHYIQWIFLKNKFFNFSWNLGKRIFLFVRQISWEIKELIFQKYSLYIMIQCSAWIFVAADFGMVGYDAMIRWNRKCSKFSQV